MFCTPTDIPAHYGILEHQGRYYPVFVYDICSGTLFTLQKWEQRLVPPALGPQHTGPISFPSRSKACHTAHELDAEGRQPLEWERLATQTEVFPERNSWFREAIESRARAMSGDDFEFFSEASRSVSLALVYKERNAYHAISADCPTRDDAFPTLYESVMQQLGSPLDETGSPDSERCSWYREAILQLLSHKTQTLYNEQDLLLHYGLREVRAATMLRQAGRACTLVGRGSTGEEALDQLYRQVVQALSVQAAPLLVPEW